MTYFAAACSCVTIILYFVAICLAGSGTRLR